MASGSKGGRSSGSKATPSLSQQTHEQLLDYLRVANESPYPEIRAAAAEIAKRVSRHELKQGARLSPTLVLWVDVVFGVAAALACWYAYLHYEDRRAAHVTSMVIRVYLVIVAISLLLSGHLSQANFMKIVGWLESQAKAGLKRLKRIAGKTQEGESPDSEE